MYNIIYETSCQSRFEARYWMLGTGALGRPRGMVWGGRREEGSGWGTRVCLWRIHFDIWQNQYNIVKFKNKIKFLKKLKKKRKRKLIISCLRRNGQSIYYLDVQKMSLILTVSHIQILFQIHFTIIDIHIRK